MPWATRPSEFVSRASRPMPWNGSTAAGLELLTPAAKGLQSSRKGSDMAARSSNKLEHFPNLVSMFLTRVRENGDKPFLWSKRDGEWRPISYNDAARQVAALAASLRKM